MRKILFRGKTSKGKWFYGNYVESTHSMVTGRKAHKAWIVTGFTSNGGWITPLGRYPVDEHTVGQYTGLTDKNGTKIFEGDIVRTFGGSHYYTVKYGSGIFYLENENEEMPFLPLYTLGSSVNAEVIGNIHDNPELMKGESES